MSSYLINQQRKKRRSSRAKFYLLVLLAFLILFGLYYMISYSDIFAVEKIKVEGDLNYFSENSLMEIIEAELLEKKLAQFLGIDNIFSWDENLVLAHPFLESLSIESNIFKREILIRVVERSRFGIWCYSGECYWFNEDGLVLERAPQTTGALVIQINDTEVRPPAPGTLVAPENFYRIVKSILTKLEARSIKFPVFTLNRSRQEFIAETEKKTDIIFSLRFDPETRIFDFLSTLIAENQIDQLEYVDLTVENRIYTK
jgi:cell division septal protein FtsQ